MPKSTLLSIDAFAKTEEDVRVRTRTGGFVTLACVLVTIMLLLKEWTQLHTVVHRPQLVLDRDRHLKLDLDLDITFPNMPCALLSLDIVDDSREIQLDLLDEGFTKTRLNSNGKAISTEEFNVHNDQVDSSQLPEDYCGPCYGARDQEGNANAAPKDRVCCQTCDDVRQAYAAKGWAFFDGNNVEQCEREGYVERLQRELHEGCRIRGKAQLNRIQGNIHFAPGRPIQVRRTHSHDSSLYAKYKHLNFNHIINHLAFGPPQKLDSNPTTGSPLDNHHAIVEQDPHSRIFSYFAKIVPTRFERLDGTVLETAEFSATAHDRPLSGGRDHDHPNTLHLSGGIPSITIYFEMSPLKVINREEHALSWSGFVLNCITSVGGVLAVGTVVDKLVYRAQRTIWNKKSR
ncbi:HDL196Cp [Eremothecium sinecaudum]|uniref:Endoplasmic reticulum-Golgi intermediate compartment protein n=1 Tax=Eremothecium sinecaudum TaxID=45286 RepID=A0A109UYY3_9SACH|nr:HDL196Cp [Eremothecium sinecaudum]AMD20548.1 HDL196Cp [Eremothecium sinecaudum]